jgi:hypothetical protein
MRKIWLSLGLCAVALLWLPGASFAQRGGGRSGGGFHRIPPPHQQFHQGGFGQGGMRPDLDRRFFDPRGFDVDRGFSSMGFGPRFVDPRIGPRFVDPRFSPRFVDPRMTPRFASPFFTGF